MRRLLWITLILSLAFSPGGAGVAGAASPGADLAEQLLARMSPEERVGQLFLVTFRGSAPRPDDPIFDLIAKGHISGVVLRARNDNFTEAPNTISSARELITSLQTAAYSASLQPAAADGTSEAPVYVPLFIAVSQEGDGGPYSEILSGATNLPSELAIGATWDESLAQAVGEVLGRELSALGINMLLGPSLDVLEDPRPEGPGDLGVRTFGGDPYWVSLLGEAYITGIHQGSQGRVAVVAKHFPGHGGSDRPLEEEVATVRKSLDELKRIELAPFFAMTDAAPGSDPSVTDALLRAHIRYQGFQDNIRATTRPVSLDPQAFADIMALEPLATWRAAGGVTISDSLGSRAIRRFYDPRETTFRGHLVARDAFLAGNDLLYLSNFQSSGDPDEVTTIRATLQFFAQKYREDSLFAQRVDEAVLRILRLKLRLYGGFFSIDRVVPSESALDAVGQGGGVVEEVARAAASLISPSPEEAPDRLGGPPRLGERIVFISDVRLASQCSTCSRLPTMALDALEATVLRLYGPRGAGEVGGWNLASFTMADLASYLGQSPPAGFGLAITPAETFGPALESADWLIFSTLGSNEGIYGSNALKLLLDRRPDLAQRARVVVFAFGVPYDLDATDLSKVDVYYGLYAKSSPFIEVAARLLFQEFTPAGAPPVSVPGIGYDLIEATSPDPDQVITLQAHAAGSEETPEPPAIGYTVGDVIHLTTGVIIDHNGHPVPDGTVVEFSLQYTGEGVTPMVLRATTVRGVAETNLTLERLGLLTISATSDPARASQILQVNVQEGIPAFVTVIAPTPVPTVPVPEASAVPTSSPTPEGGTGGSGQGGEGGLGLLDLMLGLLTIGLMAAAGDQIGHRRSSAAGARVRWLLCSAVGGLLAYNYLALGLPGGAVLRSALGWGAAVMVGGAGGLVGIGVAWMWGWLEARPRGTWLARR
ncbi:MAG: glycoside hydrolase family 3 N-terminal domain-containing protein [Chloroflexota bacterium]